MQIGTEKPPPDQMHVQPGTSPPQYYNPTPPAGQGGQYPQLPQPYGQQQSTTVTNVVINQPVPIGNTLLLTNIHGSRAWTTDLFGCMEDVPNCCLVYFCLPCMECKNATRIGECCCMPFCVPGGSIITRTRLRTLGGIGGSVCSDCLVLACCAPCAVCQMSREMDNMGLI